MGTGKEYKLQHTKQTNCPACKFLTEVAHEAERKYLVSRGINPKYGMYPSVGLCWICALREGNK